MPVELTHFSIAEDAVSSGGAVQARLDYAGTGDGSRIHFRSEGLDIAPPSVPAEDGYHSFVEQSLVLTLRPEAAPGRKTIRAELGNTVEIDAILVTRGEA